MPGEHLDVYTFQYLITEALAMVQGTVDKRQGSIIYDTLSVSDVQLAEGYIQIKGFYLDVNLLTAEGEALDLCASNYGVTRYPATAAVKLGSFYDVNGLPVAVPIGAFFRTAEDTNSLIYRVTGVYYNPDSGQTVPDSYRLTCETTGAAGNDYAGALLTVTYLNNVATAAMSELLIPARDAESDDALRARCLELINYPAFGGNVAQYRQWVMAMSGVGAVQVYPVWQGGGTVKVSIIGADYLPASDTLLRDVQTDLDPEQNHGEGLGLAPIGHTVTVSTPETVAVNVEADIALNGVTVEQVRPEIEAAIAAYLLSLRQEFGQSSDLQGYAVNVYRARINSAMLTVSGVENVTGILMNGEDADLLLTEGALVQQLPIEGMVTLHEI